MKDARQIAVEALIKVQRDRAWSNLVLDKGLTSNTLTSQDSAFASALFYGVLERMITLDACIAVHASVKLRKLSPAVHSILRAGMYQLLYMTSVPDNAAVSESVELTRKLRQPKSASFVNAVLRSFVRTGKKIPMPKSGDPVDTLSITYSCPAPLIRMWLDGYGEDTTRLILARSLGRPPLTVRVNTMKTTPATLASSFTAEGLDVAIDDAVPNCLTLRGTGAVHNLPAYRHGLFHVQDKSSQLCALALGARPGMRVLDACAAPGGKTFTIAQEMENRGEIVAVDLYEQRTNLVGERALQMGLTCIKTRCADMEQPVEGIGAFDRVLCDVPCSGLGVIRRKPEIKYKPLEEFADFPSTQYKILENSAHYCKEGGLLLYSTCTLSPAENIGVAERFLAEHPAFLPRPLPTSLPVPVEGRWYKTLTGELDADGFFLALFERAGQ